MRSSHPVLAAAARASAWRAHLADRRLPTLSQREAAPARVAIQEIIVATASYFRIRPEQIVSGVRDAETTLARHVAIYLARQHSRRSFPVIGKAFGRDHSSVMHAVRRIENLDGDVGVSLAIGAIENVLFEKCDA